MPTGWLPDGFRVAPGWLWCRIGWLCAALFLISAFSFQPFSFCPIVALGWLARSVTNHESRITSGFGWLRHLSRSLGPGRRIGCRAGGVLIRGRLAGSSATCQSLTHPFPHPVLELGRSEHLDVRHPGQNPASVPCHWRFAGGTRLNSRSGTSREKAQETQRGRAATRPEQLTEK